MGQRLNFCKGSSMWAIVAGKFAFKIPSLYNWKRFLNGLISNMQEVEFNKVEEMREKLCPILFYIPFGFLVVMPMVRILEYDELTQAQLQDFCINNNYIIPAEHKCDSFGYFKGKLVAVDYGN